MNDIEKAAQTIWDYMLMHHELKKADLIMVCGSYDIRIGQYAADLYLEGWAPILLLSGSGSIHYQGKNTPFNNSTEAEVFADIAHKAGVPKSAILIENQSQNTGQNYEFSLKLLADRGVFPNTIILVQKPYMERRTYATGKIWLPATELILTSPKLSKQEYADGIHSRPDRLIHMLVGDLQRIIEYPALGYQIIQEVPEPVLESYLYLRTKGYTNHCLE